VELIEQAIAGTTAKLARQQALLDSLKGKQAKARRWFLARLRRTLRKRHPGT
jgi:hypothetical protein